MKFVLLVILCFFIPVCARYRGPMADEHGVTFKVKVPTAHNVSIVGTFNDWDRERDRLAGPDRDGWWSITQPLGAGRHEYLFLVDGGEWLFDPHAAGVAEDGFGGRNAVVTVVSREVGAAAGTPDVRVHMKTREGQAKNVSAETLRSAVERLHQHGRIAERIVAQAAAGREDERSAFGARAATAAALVLDSGFPADEVGKLAADAAETRYPLSRFSRLLEAMVDLRDRGMPGDLALRTARQLIRYGASESEIARTEGELLYWREKQYSWVDAFYQFHSGARPGMEAPGGGLMHE
jgi:hypothetical protein